MILNHIIPVLVFLHVIPSFSFPIPVPASGSTSFSIPVHASGFAIPVSGGIKQGIQKPTPTSTTIYIGSDGFVYACSGDECPKSAIDQSLSSKGKAARTAPVKLLKFDPTSSEVKMTSSDARGPQAIGTLSVKNAQDVLSFMKCLHTLCPASLTDDQKKTFFPHLVLNLFRTREDKPFTVTCPSQSFSATRTTTDDSFKRVKLPGERYLTSPFEMLERLNTTVSYQVFIRHPTSGSSYDVIFHDITPSHAQQPSGFKKLELQDGRIGKSTATKKRSDFLLGTIRFRFASEVPDRDTIMPNFLQQAADLAGIKKLDGMMLPGMVQTLYDFSSNGNGLSHDGVLFGTGEVESRKFEFELYSENSASGWNTDLTSLLRGYQAAMRDERLQGYTTWPDFKFGAFRDPLLDLVLKT